MPNIPGLPPTGSKKRRVSRKATIPGLTPPSGGTNFKRDERDRRTREAAATVNDAINPGGGVIRYKITRGTGPTGAPSTRVTNRDDKPGIEVPGLGTLPKPGKKKAVKRGARKPVAPSPRLGPPAAPRSISRGSGPAPRGSSAAPAAPAAASRPAKKAKKTVKRTPAAATPATPATPETPPGYDTTTPEGALQEFYGPALDEITRQEAEALASRGIQIGDSSNLRNWMAGQNTAAEGFLERGLAASRVPMPENNLLAEAQKRAAAATGGNADLAQASGLAASDATLAAYQQADAARGQGQAVQGQVLTRGLADQRQVTSSQMANIDSIINAGYNNRLSDLSTERSKLSTAAAGLAQQERASQRTAAQDAKMFQLLAKEKLGNLEVARTNATTKRLQVITTAKNARLALDLKAQIENGKISRAEARDAFEQDLKTQNLSISKQKLELARFDSETKRMKATGADVSKLSDHVAERYETFLGPYGGQWESVPRDKQRKIVRNIITGMRGAGGANLSQAQAMTILGGVFGDIPLRDPAFRNMVAALWPR